MKEMPKVSRYSPAAIGWLRVASPAPANDGPDLAGSSRMLERIIDGK
jgi:hypothetical protein